MKQDILGIAFDNVTMDEAIERAAALLEEKGASYVVTPNAEIGYECLHDTALRGLINGADLVLPDGSGIILAAKILGTPLKEKVAGVDFARNLMAYLEKTGKTVFFLGSKPGVGQLAAETLHRQLPGLKVVGIRDGYFKTDAEAIEAVNAAAPDVLLVCLGAPKQEHFMHEHAAELHVSLMAGLGGTLDSIAGTVKRAPKWMIRLNLEWLYRLIKQPSRLGRMMRLPKYIMAAKKAAGNRKGG